MVTQLLKRENRVKLYLEGVGLELRAAFHRSGSHKLPGKMGELREDALASFLKEWLPIRYRARTNVLSVHQGNHELNRELDLVILDELDGLRLPLDADGGVTLVSWRDIRLHIEVKSILGPAEFSAADSAAEACKNFANDTKTSAPPSILFAYDVEKKWFEEDLLHGILTGTPACHFDVIAILGQGIYFSSNLREFTEQINSGLTREMAENDCSIAEKGVMHTVNHPSGDDGFIKVGTNSDADVLFGVMAFVSKTIAKDSALSDELITAAQRPLYTPLEIGMPKVKILISIASQDWKGQGDDIAFVGWLSFLRKSDSPNWNLLLCLHFGISVHADSSLDDIDGEALDFIENYTLAYVSGSEAATWSGWESFPTIDSQEDGLAKAVQFFELEKKALKQLGLQKFMTGSEIES